MDGPIYLDYNATTPIDPRVVDAMLPYLQRHFGNPSTTYQYGLRTKEAVEHARQQVASLLSAQPEEIVFTSGGTESDNHAIIGVALANMHKGKHIISASIEHPAVINTCRYLEQRLGFSVTYVPVDGYGMVDPETIRRAITKETILVTIMHANNEVGSIQPIAAIADIAHGHGIILHTDAAQSCGKIEVNVSKLGVDLLSVAGHKLYAPKGIGALYIKQGTNIDSYLHGASQENGRRAGTENVPYFVALGQACALAAQHLPEYESKIRPLRDRLYAGLVAGLGQDNVRLNGHPDNRLPNTLNVSIRGIVGEDLLARIPEMAASTGAACHAGSTEPSSVLLNMGLTRDWALGALRLTLGRSSTQEEIDTVVKLITDRVRQMTIRP